MTTATAHIDFDELIRDSHRTEALDLGVADDADPLPSALQNAPTRADIRRGLALRALGVLVWVIGLLLFAVGGLAWSAGLALAAGAVLGLLGFGLAELGDRYMPAGDLAEYVASCDPDFSQSWAVGIALGGGSGCGGGGDGGGGGGGC